MRTFLVLALFAISACSHEDDLDAIEASRRAEAPIKAACLELTAPVSTRVGPATDADPATPSVEVAISVQVRADCTATALQIGQCTVGGVAPSEAGRRELSVAPGQSYTIAIALSNSAGPQLPCLYLDKSYSYPVERVCEGSEVLCTSDRSCQTDTQSNPERCGVDCRKCPAGDQGTPTCSAGVCGLACAEGYRYEAGACRPRPGCKAQATACAGDDCCAIDRIAADDGTALRYRRGYDQGGPASELPELQSATSDQVSIDPFYLDRYEVTVGRFRSFVDAYERWRGGANPRTTHGGHPRVPTSRWQSTWNERETLPDGTTQVSITPSSRAELVSAIKACNGATWTDSAAANENLPINCVSFFVAYLYCMFDGDGSASRLPSEAEWNAAAAAGADQRAYPWSMPASSLERRGLAAPGALQAVGKFPDGRGRWGSFDLAGNVAEWVRDSAAAAADGFRYVAVPSDPIDLRDDFYALTPRVVRGGSFLEATCAGCATSPRWRSSARTTRNAYEPTAEVGFRCARSYP